MLAMKRTTNELNQYSSLFLANERYSTHPRPVSVVGNRGPPQEPYEPVRPTATHPTLQPLPSSHTLNPAHTIAFKDLGGKSAIKLQNPICIGTPKHTKIKRHKEKGETLPKMKRERTPSNSSVTTISSNSTEELPVGTQLLQPAPLNFVPPRIATKNLALMKKLRNESASSTSNEARDPSKMKEIDWTLLKSVVETALEPASAGRNWEVFFELRSDEIMAEIERTNIYIHASRDIKNIFHIFEIALLENYNTLKDIQVAKRFKGTTSSSTLSVAAPEIGSQNSSNFASFSGATETRLPTMHDTFTFQPVDFASSSILENKPEPSTELAVSTYMTDQVPIDEYLGILGSIPVNPIGPTAGQTIQSPFGTPLTVSRATPPRNASSFAMQSSISRLQPEVALERPVGNIIMMIENTKWEYLSWDAVPIDLHETLRELFENRTIRDQFIRFLKTLPNLENNGWIPLEEYAKEHEIDYIKPKSAIAKYFLIPPNLPSDVLSAIWSGMKEAVKRAGVRKKKT